MFFIEEVAGLKICLFRYVFCRNLYSKNLLFSYRFYTTVVNNGLLAAYLLLTNSSFTLLLTESQGMFNFGQTCLFQPIPARLIWKLYYKEI